MEFIDAPKPLKILHQDLQDPPRPSRGSSAALSYLETLGVHGPIRKNLEEGAEENASRKLKAQSLGGNKFQKH